MAEEQVSDKQLIEALLRERDELYRRAVKAERRCEELSGANAMKQHYEARINEKDNEIAQMKAEHQKQISNMEANHQKEISKKEDEYKQVLSKKEDEIRSLVARIEYMARKLWGKMSEKRQTPVAELLLHPHPRL